MSKIPKTVYTRRSLRSNSKMKKDESPSKLNYDWISENDSDSSEKETDAERKKDSSIRKGDSVKKSHSNLNSLENDRIQETSAVHIPFPKQSQNNCILLLIMVTLLTIFSLMYHFDSNSESNSKSMKFSSSKMQSSPKLSVSEKLIAREIQKIRRNFPLQSKNVWLNTVAALNSITADEPSQPAVLLLISSNSEEAKKTLSCLSLQLAATTNTIFNTSSKVVQVDGFIQFLRKEEIKEELDRKLKSILNESFAVVVPQLQEIPPYAAMILHGYCDNYLAPFKKRVIIITAALGSQVMETQAQVDRYLRRLWDAEMGIDRSASLVSRVANIPVFVQPELGNVLCL